MHLLSDLVGIAHRCHVSRDNRRDARLLRRIDNRAHQGQVLAVNHGVHRQVTLQAMLLANQGDAAQIIRREVVRRAGTHVQALNTEIDRVGSALDGGHQ